MLADIEFVRFRGFERLKARLTPHAYIVGPNSAGKSTVLEAIGLAELCLRSARRKNPVATVVHNGRRLKGFLLPASVEHDDDPFRYDFGRQETRVSLRWDNGSCINMIWPEENDGGERAFFYLEEEDGTQPISASAARKLFSPVTVVPVVAPLDRMEELKDPAYVEARSGTRLASRHFRNHVWLMWKQDRWADFKAFCTAWLPEIELLDVSLNTSANRLAVFYSEAGSRVPKELAWAGDGIQIWVQLLWHLFRAKESVTIVLDEPEVYLHPDLQRRLVRLLDGMSAQVILASHSADVIAEAPPEGVLWVDRRLGGARRANCQQSLSNLSASLGSSYNLALARSMRARLVVASDCEDLRIIRLLAKLVGANNLANEQTVSLVPLREVGNWLDRKNVGKSLREVLPSKLPAVLLLQAGFRPPNLNAMIVDDLTQPGITATILTRTEIENYLLDAETIARASGAASEAVAQHMAEACIRLREATRAAFTATWVRGAKEGRGNEALLQAENTFDAFWSIAARRAEIVRGTQVIKELNIWLETDGYRTISGYQLAKVIRPQTLTAEILNVILEIEEMVR
jgi:hypothetical protein